MRDVPADEYIPKGATLAIKEPYLHMDMTHTPHDTNGNTASLKSRFFVLRVDHPADLMILSPCDMLVPLQFRTAHAVDPAATCKERGNAAFVQGRILEAQRW